MDWVNELREQFPVTRKTVFLDIAYENGGSTYVTAATEQFVRDCSDVSPVVVKKGGAGKGKTIDVVAETRRLVAELLGGVNPKNTAFTKNTNEGVSIILQGFPFLPGDNVITNDQEHPSVLLPCLNLQRNGVECRIAVSPDQVSVTPDLLWEQVDDRTRMIVVSHVQSSTGYRIDLEQLAYRCRHRGIYLVVDAIQSLGFCPVDAKTWGVDAIASACYKGMLGIHGLGVLYCGDRLLQEVWPRFAASNACIAIDKGGSRWEVVCRDPLDARKLENSTLNLLGIYVLNAGLQKLLGIGMDTVYEHISRLVEVLYEGLTDLGFDVVTPKDKERRCHTISIKMTDVNRGYRYFQDRGVFLSLAGGRFVRMSIAPFTTDEDIRAVLAIAGDCPIR
ncbi:MAG: aminotransferase class V-fold PLP-dependent enzyme [Bacillota bacterium]|jgi:cysteine desulfurase/selenocysteine lyase